MSQASFASLRPAIITSTVPVAAFAHRFFETYGKEEAWITGPDGARVEHLHLAMVREHWWRNPRIAQIAASSGHVVHWPIGGRAFSEPFQGLLQDIRQLLSRLGPGTECLLDRFRRADTPTFLWAIVGPCLSEIPTHRDIYGTASWNLLLSGSKHWQFWSSEQSPAMEEPIMHFNQQPGELVWIPEDWWHSVRYLAPSLCLSKNIVPARALDTISARLGSSEPTLARHLAAMAIIPRCQLER